MNAAPAQEAQALNESTPETMNLPGHANNGTSKTYHNEGVNQGAKLAENITRHIGPVVLIPIPKGQKGPKLLEWQKLTLADITPDYLAGLAGGNVGVSLGTASGGLVTIDADSDEFLEAFLATNTHLQGTLITKGARGGNVWVRIKGDFPKAGKLKTADSEPWGEFRADGNQTVIYGTHPSGCQYTHNSKTPLCVEFSTIQWPAGLRLPWVEGAKEPIPAQKSTGFYKGAGSSVVERARKYVDTMPPAIQGQGGSDATFNVAKKLVHDFNLSHGEAMSILQDYNARCSPPWSVKDLIHKLEDAAKCSRSTTGRGELAEASRPDYRALQHHEVATVESVDPVSNDVPTPVLSEAALYGIAGDIVRKIAPESEAHPAALLVQLLVGMGSIMGSDPFFQTESDKQHTNLFAVIVGHSSSGGKGTSWGRIRNILEQVDPRWFSTRVLKGMGSGESLIPQLQDEEGKEPKDKRLLINEGEFATPLAVMGRQSCTLSSMLRDAWDSVDIQNHTKAASLRATNPHVSLISHITPEELREKLTENDAANGFLNRILLARAARTKDLSEGGKPLYWDDEVRTLQGTVEFARGLGEMKRTQEAREYWATIYGPMKNNIPPGKWGNAVSRGCPQVVRLSMIYALLDLSQQVKIEHLQAAKAVWDYCFHSARWALEECRYSKDAQKILEALHYGPKDRTYVVSHVFSGNIQKRRLDAALKEIEDNITIETQGTEGRTRTIYSLKTHTT
jgi:hypothetical protein